MRFAKSFQRRVGGSLTIPVLGSDPVPTTTPPGPDVVNSNMMTAQFANSAGWPLHRIAVTWACTNASALPIPGDLYVFEENIGQWVRANPATKLLRPNRLTFFDIVGLGQANPGVGRSSTLGGLDMQLVAGLGSNGGNAGTYSFAMSGDLTTNGEDDPDLSAPAESIRAATLNDGVDLPDGPCDRLLICAAGTVKFTAAGDTTAQAQSVTVNATLVPFELPIRCARVWATGTSIAAASILCLYT